MNALQRKPRFQVGDYVYLKTGHAPQVVLEIRPGSPAERRCGSFMLRCDYTRYFKDMDRAVITGKWRTEEDFLLYEYDPSLHDFATKCPRGNRISEPKEEEETPMSKLYQTIEETPRFGTFLARNSAGQIVLEMKDSSGKVEAFDTDKVEEVLAYTVLIMFDDGSGTHYEAPKGKLQEGDFLIFPDGRYGRVKTLNTGKETYRPLPVKIRRVVTEEI